MKTNIINWQIKSFDELNTHLLYEILKLRAEVFVVEQNCPYQDLDSLDKQCYHLLGWSEDGNLVAYARILPEGVNAYELKGEGNPVHGSIGRVVVSPTYRGIGHELMDRALKAYDMYIGKEVTCIIHAQAHLKNFYEKHGFRQSSEVHLIDNIDHIEMTREV